ncbi:Phosphatidylserine decarboxylase proenzyme 3 [Penicillium diatomitis]|uniref:Phosphatidylserine decarboxylase proenzyme 2 n=1 Tax=Penicillium diatomitis TaxID=2819901 RepID=A0A9X0BNF5_9EURO|nr:Phosphatidylserine decarboxylase proenzyme 3 [Penicillium diatomitis]KAJ5475631.1 Phosphatidylserine decarboxylase proenzyme 3 [Penicillium diatomitis]
MYLVVTLGDSRQSTPTISKTLNPEWNVSFDMPIAGVPLLEFICWDHDRFGKDYMGEIDIALEDIFADGQIAQEHKKKKREKKDSNVSGEILLQFSLVDPATPTPPPADIYRKFRSLVRAGEEDDSSPDEQLQQLDLDDDLDQETSDETDDPSRPEVVETRRRRHRLARLRKRSLAARAYQFSGSGTGVQGIVFIEVVRVRDLPPEHNVTRTSFDMDPFVVTSLGRKTLRTPVIRHNLNPVYHEKMVFQVMKHEQMYTISFTVMDRDKFSGNDFVASASFPLQKLIASAPEADPNSGLYHFVELDAPDPNKSSPRLAVSPSPSSTNFFTGARPILRSQNSATSVSSQSILEMANRASSAPNSSENVLDIDTSSSTLQVPAPDAKDPAAMDSSDSLVIPEVDDEGLREYRIPLILKNRERWEAKHSPELFIKAKYLPYSALRQQFWRLMLKQYDADESGRIDKVEMITMLDTLGSTLKESTVDGFFKRFSSPDESEAADLSFDECVICLEDTLRALQKKGSQPPALTASLHGRPGVGGSPTASQESERSTIGHSDDWDPTYQKINANSINAAVPTISSDEKSSSSDGDHPDDLADERGEEHVVEIRECPLCHQPRLSKRSDADIITHIATCASRDWRQVDNLVMGGFVTSSQAQRKWYSKVITKLSYGGYKLGANSANILVQDRITGQINEERMSVYVRLGIRLLYKGIKSKDMEKKRIRRVLKSLSIKQGRKYDDPASASQIRDFINFHRLDMSEVLLPLDQFRTFNEFFYRALKPGARPCSAPDEPRVVVSPADCRSVVFDRMSEATGIWVKGREFSVERLLGNAYPEDAARYKNGALGVFRLAPQDYHRFHIPVDGVMGEPKTIEGEYYTVNPMAIRSALDVYGENVRVLVPIDSVAHGRVMVVCVGAMMVGSTVITRNAGENVSRAEELGYFKFGGSTILLLFEEGKINFDSDLVDNSKGALETLIRVGMSVAHAPDVPQHEPDMPKRAEDVTQDELQAAQRRIAGSLESPANPEILAASAM